MWSREEAISLCCEIEAIAPAFGCHVALTGGTLYKGGLRKDADVLFYRIRQEPMIDKGGLLLALEKIGFLLGGDHGFVVKGTINGKNIDLFFPETPDGEYPGRAQSEPLEFVEEPFQ